MQKRLADGTQISPATSSTAKIPPGNQKDAHDSIIKRNLTQFPVSRIGDAVKRCTAAVKPEELGWTSSNCRRM